MVSFRPKKTERNAKAHQTKNMQPTKRHVHQTTREKTTIRWIVNRYAFPEVMCVCVRPPLEVICTIINAFYFITLLHTTTQRKSKHFVLVFRFLFQPHLLFLSRKLCTLSYKIFINLFIVHRWRLAEKKCVIFVAIATETPAP